MTRSIADYAEAYVKQYGMALVPLPPRTKRPVAKDWGQNVITDPQLARDYYTQNPDWNMGAALGPSRLCSFDVDDIEATQAIFDEFGWDLNEIRSQNPTIQGAPGGFRVMFRVPDDVQLVYHALTWPKKDGTPGRFTVWEIRAADAEQRQDVLPPSIHPDTQQPYQWLVRPADVGGFKAPPEFLLQMWRNWDALKPQLQAVCPWAEQPTVKQSLTTRQPPANGDSVIDAYNQAHGIEETLAQYGYKRQGKRYLSPHSTTKLPGVIIWPGNNKCFIHHASDPLCSDESGQPVGPFDLFTYYEHGGDMKKAAKAAAEQLGMKRKPTPPALPKPAPAKEVIDQETGEVIVAANDNVPAMVDYFTDLQLDARGKPIGIIENLGVIANRLGVTIRYNVVKKEDEILIPDHSFSVDNAANAALAWLRSECVKFRYPTEALSDYVTYLADQNLYNPVAEWILSKPWDGQSRLQDLCDTIQADDEELKCILLKRWMISAVAAAFKPDGVSAHGVLTLQGDQYLGKTKWFKSLVPDHLGLVKDGMLLQPHDKDSVKQVCSFWLVELGELDATFRKSDIAALKSFITNQSDVLRRPFAKKESHFARRTVFFASVNPKQFLHDATGNRRYWTIAAKWIDHSHLLDMQQVWAEVLDLYNKGEPYYLQPDEMERLNKENEEFTVIDPVHERLESRLQWNAPVVEWTWRSATDILAEVGLDKPSVPDVNKGAAFIRQKNGNQGKRTHNGRQLLAPPKVKPNW
jgi:predicted P-loop ATPase